MIDVTMRQMLEAGVHFGHQTRFWNPKMAPFIYGARHRIHIINLEETLPLFREAMKFVSQIASSRGKLLFVGTKFSARDIVREEATRSGMPYIDHRWLGGMLTNYKTIRQSIKRLKDLEERVSHEENLVGMTKKEVLNLMREKDKLAANLSGIKNMGGLPDAIFVIDVGHEKIAVQEACRLGIPIIGIVDTNASPENIDYVIPGNDDALRSIRFYCQTFADTIIGARGALQLADLKEVEEKDQAKEDTKRIVTKKSKIAEVAKAEQFVQQSDAELENDEADEKKVMLKKKRTATKKVVASEEDDKNVDADDRL